MSGENDKKGSRGDKNPRKAQGSILGRLWGDAERTEHGNEVKNVKKTKAAPLQRSGNISPYAVRQAKMKGK